MLHTVLTDQWELRFPIISAPMAGPTDGRFAACVSRAGGLGMIGIGSGTALDFIQDESDKARQGGKFGLGLMVWAVKKRPELLEAVIAAKPDLVSLSFGDPTPYVSACHAANIAVATQVHSRAEARQAQAAGVDLVVAQGSEAGGHTGSVSTLPLLQIVLDEVACPVVAAGGIASPRGIAAVLAAGAAGVWIGTGFLATPESRLVTAQRDRIVAARETETVLTHVFDYAQNLDWPDPYPGRALKNRFTDEWHARVVELRDSDDGKMAFRQSRGNYEVDYIYAGQAVGLVKSSEQSLASLLEQWGNEAEHLLRQRAASLLG